MMPDMPALVLDTNVVLDLLLFEDPSTAALRADLDAGRCRWIATAAMREELARVLTYPHLAAWAVRHGRDTAQVLAEFDARTQCVPEAPLTTLRCSDADDQKFIDLAVLHQAGLWSKDHAVRRLRKGMEGCGVRVW